MSATSPSSSAAAAAAASFEPYTQLGMQKLSYLYKNNLEKANVATEASTESSAGEHRAKALNDMQQIVEAAIGDRAKQEISQILDRISLLKPQERLLLYMRMPNGTPETDPLRQSQNPLGTRSEINHTINWVRTHLEHDPNVSIPKQDVYDDYILYCNRVNIKPLSTADFGKVMKQVFPEIRPRRLGTRGNSRYCYAALRKTMNLAPPMMPDLSAVAGSTTFAATHSRTVAGAADSGDEESCGVIKKWAASLLNVDFKKTKDLAEYITTNQLHLPSNCNRLRSLQKKILSKEMRNNKKLNESGTAKKRRRKRRKDSCSSDASHGHSSPLTDTGADASKVEINVNNIKQEVVTVIPVKDENHQSTNTASTSTDCNGSTRSPLQRPMKEELSDSDDIQPSILCKKVRQAQQTKGIWVQPNKQPPQQVIMVPASPQNDTAMDVTGLTQLMRPPKYNHTHSRVAQASSTPFASIGEAYNTKKSVAAAASAAATAASATALVASSMPQRTNRNRNIPQTAVSRADTSETNDDVTTNIIMPRERVISICNLDKDALDGYLIGGDNSQDQEAELLKYFQPEDSSSAVAATAVGDSTNSAYDYTVNMKQNNTSSSIPENYQLCNNDDTTAPMYSKFGKKPCYDKGQISELRYYLQSSFANQQNDPTFQPTSGGAKVETAVSGNLHPASTALSMISNRLIRDKEYLKLPNAGATVLGPKERRSAGFADVIPTTNSNNIPQSPNSRRKNFSFVPISPGPQSPRTSSFTFAHQSGGISTQASANPFVSPRATSATQRHKTIRFSSTGSSMATASGVHQTFNPSSIGSGPSDFQNVQQFKEEISLSAPPSPSSHGFRITNDRFPATTTSIAFPTTKLHDQHTSDVSMENRSQSAPLHYHMPKSSTYKLNLYSSASNSVAQTPVPADYSDFSDGSSFIDMLESPGSTANIKMESGDILPGLLDSDLSVRLAEMVPDLSVRQLGSMSRSVPSTPQPLFSGHVQQQQQHRRGIDHRQHKSFDMSKSVPTTPIGMQGTPFRYSPEHNRDFLINGNTIETGQLASFYQQRQLNMTQQQHHEAVLSDKELPIAEEIDELSAFGEDADPIIGSDLLNNL